MDEFFGTFFGSTRRSASSWPIWRASLLKDIWETFYSTVLATFFAYVIGLPLGVHPGDRGAGRRAPPAPCR